MINNNRIFGLDLLRFTAILLVLIYHGLNFIYDQLPSFFGNIICMFSGKWGVALFFALSGFLVGGLFIKLFDGQKKVDYKSLSTFLKRRLFRTIPNFYLVFLIEVMVLSLNGRSFELVDLLKYLTFTQFFESEIPTFFIQSWTLSIEEWFYLTYPLFSFTIIKLVFKSNYKKGILISIICYILIFNILRFILFIIDYLPNTWYHITYLRLDAIVYGVLLAYFHYYYFDILEKYKNKLIIIFVFLILFFSIIEVFYYKNMILMFLAQTFLPVIFCLSIPFFYYFNINKSHLISKIITHISKISYSIYLINFEVYIFIQNFVVDEKCFFMKVVALIFSLILIVCFQLYYIIIGKNHL